MSAVDFQDEDVQRDRARQAWELVVLRAPDDAELEILRRILRVKRFELGSFRGSLPGRVRRGARVDLAPLEQALTRSGIACALRRARPPTPSGSA